jgi:tripeptide aminopeptidase
LFCALAAIPSPTGQEAACASLVEAELTALGLEVERDGVAALVDGDCDNLYCEISPTTDGRPLFLCAHLDTVPPSGVLEPVVTDGVIRNATPSIVGADNKAAVAVLLRVVSRLCVERIAHAGVELVFTVGEEQGLRGSRVFDTNRLRAKTGFVLDHPGAIGGYVVAAPSRFVVSGTMRGRASHTGISPDQSVNAIAALARAVSIFPSTTSEVTVNVVQMKGGTALNVVPEYASVSVDVRSLGHENALNIVRQIERTLQLVGDITGCTADVQVDNPYDAYRLGCDSEARHLAETAALRLGLNFDPIETRGGSDANAFRSAGLDCLNLAHAVVDFHGPEERVAVADLVLMEKMMLEVIGAACGRPLPPMADRRRQASVKQ